MHSRSSASPVLLVVQAFLYAALVIASSSAQSAEPGSKILLIGGPKSNYTPGAHDYPNSIRFVEAALRSSPEVAAHPDLVIEAHPYEWPDAGHFEGAATLVFNFSGVDLHPLLDPQNRQVVQQLMDRGVGLVALHQSFTVPEEDTSVPLIEWLGGARYGMADRTTQPAKILVTRGSHPLLRGLTSFIHYDEFYPTIRFGENSGQLTPIWTADLPIHYVKGKPTADGEIASYTLAWSYERDNGGRSFAYSGGHFLEGWDNAPARRLLLNSILWTAGKDVPLKGVTTTVPSNTAEILAFPHRARGRVTKAVVSRQQDNKIVVMPWGQIEWHVAGDLDNSDSLTTGIARIIPGQANPRHYHPNCDEVLHVLKGHIRHTMDDVTVEMKAGDTVSIPRGVHHNAVNIGDEEAALAISFSTAWREVVGE